MPVTTSPPCINQVIKTADSHRLFQVSIPCQRYPYLGIFLLQCSIGSSKSFPSAIKAARRPWGRRQWRTRGDHPWLCHCLPTGHEPESTLTRRRRGEGRTGRRDGVRNLKEVLCRPLSPQFCHRPGIKGSEKERNVSLGLMPTRRSKAEPKECRTYRNFHSSDSYCSHVMHILNSVFPLIIIFFKSFFAVLGMKPGSFTQYQQVAYHWLASSVMPVINNKRGGHH